MGLLQKGLKYNMHTKKKNWIQTLVLEAETTTTQLPTNERDVYRKLAAERIENCRNRTPPTTHPEAKIIQSIQRKLKEHDSMVTRTDKGNTIVMIPTHQYENKLQDFIQNNDFHTKGTDTTKTFQTQIRTTIQQSPTLIAKDCRWKYNNVNPTKNLEDTPMLPHYNLASLDNTNLYSNIPVKETKTIFANILTHNLIALPNKTRITQVV